MPKVVPKTDPSDSLFLQELAYQMMNQLSYDTATLTMPREAVIAITTRLMLISTALQDYENADDTKSHKHDLFDGDGHVRNPVEGVEDSEYVDAGIGGVLNEATDDVVGVIGVADSIGAPEQHLEKNVRHGCAQLGKSLPRVFFEKPIGHIESRAAPHLDAEERLR